MVLSPPLIPHLLDALFPLHLLDAIRQPLADLFVLGPVAGADLQPDCEAHGVEDALELGEWWGLLLLFGVLLGGGGAIGDGLLLGADDGAELA